jgi:hypothetical protein
MKILDLTQASGKTSYKIQDQCAVLGFKIQRNVDASAKTIADFAAYIYSSFGDALLTVKKRLGSGTVSILIDNEPIVKYLEIDALSTGSPVRVTADAAKFLVEGTITLTMAGSMPLDKDTYLEVIVTPGASSNVLKVYNHSDGLLVDSSRKIEKSTVLANSRQKITLEDSVTGFAIPSSTKYLTLRTTLNTEVEFEDITEIKDFLAERRAFPFLFNGLVAPAYAWFVIPKVAIWQFELETSQEDSVYMIKDKVFGNIQYTK